MAGVSIDPVSGWRDHGAFVDLPYRLHAGTPWVPPLKLERRLFLSRRLNPFFKHGEAQLFLARRGDRVVGRVSAQIDRAFNEYHGSRWGMFGFLEMEDDPEVLAGLLGAAEGWLRERGCERMVGPMDFTMNEESGVLIDGFELQPMIRQPWHPPYYQRLCEEAGLEKAKDLYSWELDISNRGTTLLPVLEELAVKAREEHGVTIRRMSRRHLRREMDLFAELYNEAWKDNWGFVPYAEEDLDTYAVDLQLVYTRDWFMAAEKDGETIAIAITPLDLNQVLKRMRGRLLPLGWWHFLNRGRTVDRVRIGFLGVRPEYQHTGVAAALYIEHFDTAARARQKSGEAGWILEDNEAMNRGLEAMGGRIVKRYRVYGRSLGTGA
jgi:GNAT superfamily N-acetyltransferase